MVDDRGAPSASGIGARSLGLRSALLTVIATAFLLVPAAQASAFDATIDIEGSGSGTVEGFTFSEPGEVEGEINCSGPPPTGDCESSFGTSGNVNVTAVPDPGSEFVGWSLEGGQVGIGCEGTETECLAFAEEESFTLTAVFDEEPVEGFTATIDIEGSGSGTVEGFTFSEPGEVEGEINCSGPPPTGDCESSFGTSGNVNVTAVPDPGSEFVGWSLEGGQVGIGCEGTETECLAFAEEESFTLTAVFDEEPVEGFTATIDIEGSGSGTVEGFTFSEPGEVEGEINCSGPPPTGDCESSFGTSGNVNVTAVPDPGSEFVGWSLEGGQVGIGCEGTETECLAFAEEESFTLTAVFDEEPVEGFTATIDIEGSGSGTVEGFTFSEPGEVEGEINCSGPPPTGDCESSFGTSGNVNVTAVPDPGSEFVGWSLEGGQVGIGCEGTETECLAFAEEESFTLTAVFDEEPVEGFTATIDIEGSGSGTVEGFTFSEPGEVEGEINCSGPPPTGDCESSFGTSGNVNVTAVPDPGSEFVGWSLEGGQVGIGCEGTETECLAFAEEESFTLTAVFDEEPVEGFTATIDIEGSGSGTVEGFTFSEPGEVEGEINCSGPPPTGDCESSFGTSGNVNVTAVPDPGSEFVGWSLEGGQVGIGCEGTETECLAFAEEESFTLTAVFDSTGPVVTNLEPDQGPPAGGNTVAIEGSNLENAEEVKFGPTVIDDEDFISNTDTKIEVTAPAGTGTVDVRVVTAAGESPNTAADDYTYAACVLPTVTKLEPKEGPTAGGNTVIVTGTNFTGATEVKFGANPGTSVVVESATKIKITAPAGTGTVDVRVVTPCGESTNTTADNYIYRAPPTVTKLEPKEGPPAGGNTVIITGTNFTGATQVKFGANPGTGLVVESSIKIKITAPAGTGTVDVRVVTPGGESANTAADNYTYVAAPTVTEVIPDEGPTAGGNTVTIKGTNFTGATEAKFGANAGTGLVVESSTEIKVTAPAGTGTVDVIVTTPGGPSANTAADNYTYVAAPTCSISPNQGPTAGGTAVTITGTNLTGATEVKFGANPGTGLVVESSTEIKVTAPAGTGTVDVTVTTPGGTATCSGGGFTYVAAPTVTEVIPDEGPTAGGNTVTIKGTNFTGATQVKFGANLGTDLEVKSATEIEVTAPAGAAGTVDVIVTTLGGPSANTGADDYTYVVAPAVTSVSPTEGSTGGGNTVTIEGTNLGNATEVKFGTTVVSSPFVSNSATKIEVKAPAHSAGPVDVRVVTAGGESANTGADDYTYVAPPAVLEVDPNKGPVAGGNEVEIFGMRFEGASKVEFGTTSISCPSSECEIADDETIFVIAPAHATGKVDVKVTTVGGTSSGSFPNDDYTYEGPAALTVTAAGTGSGSVSCNGGFCAVSYAFGTEVTLAAVANPGSTFAGWSGACSGTGTCALTMDAAKSVTATFNANPIVLPPPPPPPPNCVVPKLKNMKLGKAKSALRDANCTTGKVTKPKPKKGKKQGPLVVKSSNPGAGTTLPANSKVDLRLKHKPKK